MSDSTKKLAVDIYTDGACRGNPGPGGYGIVLEASGYKSKELSKGFRLTTNNRMELLAIIDALKSLKRDDLAITIYSDSKYVVEAVNNGWVYGWMKKGFKDKKNPDLWREYLKLHKKFNPKLVWIKGHNDHPQNERCDKLAVQAAKAESLNIDTVFEANKEQQDGLFE
jgi:ribonuclease HI